MSLETAVLDNGLTIWVDPIPGADVNDVSVLVPFGSVNEPPREEGVAHAFEHCVFLQTDRFKDRDAVNDYELLNGMDVSANTGYTRTKYIANGADIEPNLIYLSQVLQHTHFPVDVVAEELRSVRREVLMEMDDVDLLHCMSSYLAAFGQPYGRNIAGFHDKLDFEAGRLEELHDRYYRLGNMALVVSGEASLDKVATLATEYFIDTGKNDTLADGGLTVTLGQSRTTGLVREESNNVRIKTIHPLTPELRTELEGYSPAFDVAFGALNTACFRALCYREGISYDGGAYYSDYNHSNAWAITGVVTTDKENVGKALAVFDEFFEKTGAEFDRDLIVGCIAKERYEYKKCKTSPQERASLIFNSLVRKREPIDYLEKMRLVEELTVDDVRAAIDSISEIIQKSPKYVHKAGTREGIGDVERIIDVSEFI